MLLPNRVTLNGCDNDDDIKLVKNNDLIVKLSFLTLNIASRDIQGVRINMGIQ